MHLWVVGVKANYYGFYLWENIISSQVFFYWAGKIIVSVWQVVSGSYKQNKKPQKKGIFLLKTATPEFPFVVISES